MDLISRADLMNDLDTSVVFSGRMHEPGEHNSEVVGAQKVINRIEAAPEVKAIPIEWIKEFVNLRATNDGIDGYWHCWGEDVLLMIAQWEKENE